MTRHDAAAPSMTTSKLLPLLVALLLYGAAVADFLYGSPGDATALLAGSLASATGALLLLPKKRVEGCSMEQRLRAAIACFGLAAAIVFGKIAEDVIEGESILFDHTVSQSAHRFDTPTLDIVMQGFSTLGDINLAICLGVMVSIWCWPRQGRTPIGVLAIVAVLYQALEPVLKQIFERPRPTLFHEVAVPQSSSFPSGHAMVAVAIYGLIAILAVRQVPRLRFWISGAVAMLVLVIGYSRVYLGLHWATDVLGGFAVGGVILAAGTLCLVSLPGRHWKQTGVPSGEGEPA